MERHKYTQDFDRFVREHEGEYTVKELANKFNLTSPQVANYLYRRNIKVKYESKNRVRDMDMLPIGTERVKGDGMTMIKVGKKKWEYKQRYIYEQYYQVKLPTETMVVFLDNDRNNFDINNLMAVDTREHLLARNKKILSNDREVNRTALLIGKLYYKTKEREIGINPSRKKFQNHKHRMIVNGVKFKPVPNTGCFKKGNISYNKGKKWDEYLTKEQQERAKTTCFQKGNTPVNHRQVGEERITRDGFIEIKTVEPNTWELKHRVVWEQNYGKIKDDELITFLDGNKLNCSIDNLTKITKSENAFMNKKQLRINNRDINEVAIMAARLHFKAKEKENGNNN